MKRSADGTEETRERVLAYLLGELPAGELAEFDRRLLRDESFAASLEAARVDLLDEYARREGPHGRRERIGRALNLTGEADASVRVARALAHQLARAGVPRASERRGASRAPLRWAVMLAACGVLGIGLWRYGPWGAGTGTGAPPAAARYTLLLRPARLRSARAPQRVRLPPAARPLRVQIVLHRGVSGAEVTVRGAAGVRRLRALRLHHLQGRPFVQFTLSPRGLPPGLYRFSVRARRDGQVSTERYWVEIASR